MGVQEMTRFGMKEEDFDGLAEFITDVVLKDQNVKEEVKTYRQQFLEMKYCLSSDKAIPVVAKILTSISPNTNFVEMFLKNLEQNL
jgi:hypothetical protein